MVSQLAPIVRLSSQRSRSPLNLLHFSRLETILRVEPKRNDTQGYINHRTERTCQLPLEKAAII